jgi:hypothetical protein
MVKEIKVKQLLLTLLFGLTLNAQTITDIDIVTKKDQWAITLYSDMESFTYFVKKPDIDSDQDINKVIKEVLAKHKKETSGSR